MPLIFTLQGLGFELSSYPDENRIWQGGSIKSTYHNWQWPCLVPWSWHTPASSFTFCIVKPVSFGSSALSKCHPIPVSATRWPISFVTKSLCGFQRKTKWISWYIEPSLNDTLRAVSWLSGTDKVCGLLPSSFMIFPPHLPVALLLQAALCLASSTANFSIDDQDPLFQYSGSWVRITTNLNSTGGNLDKDGGHMLTYTPGSSATITYTCAYLLKVNSIIIISQPIPFPPFFFSLSIFTW